MCNIIIIIHQLRLIIIHNNILCIKLTKEANISPNIILIYAYFVLISLCLTLQIIIGSPELSTSAIGVMDCT